MPYRVTFALDPQPPSYDPFPIVLDCLTTIDALYLKAHPETPPVDASGVKRIVETPGHKDWTDIPTSIQKRTVNAESYAAWKAAEERVRGRRADPMTYLTGPVTANQGRRITLALDLFNGEQERVLSRQALNVMLRCLFMCDVQYLKAFPQTPSIYRSGIRYREEPPGQEDWQDIPTCRRMGLCDCEDLGCADAAELVVQHSIPAEPFFTETKRPNGSYMYHILDRYLDPRTRTWKVRDPSKTLGMR